MGDHVFERMKTCNLGQLEKGAAFVFKKNDREPYQILSKQGNTVEVFNINSGDRLSFNADAQIIPVWVTTSMSVCLSYQ